MKVIYEALTGRYMPHMSAAPPQAVIALSFGGRKSDPGLANKAIARDAIHWAEEIGGSVPHGIVFAQWEVAQAIKEIGAIAYLGEKGYIEPVSEEEKKYFDTGHVLDKAEQAITDYAESAGRVIIAHAFHAPRVDRMAQKRGIDTLLPHDLPTVWDPESMQPWTRTPALWLLREPLVIVEHVLKGKI